MLFIVSFNPDEFKGGVDGSDKIISGGWVDFKFIIFIEFFIKNFKELSEFLIVYDFLVDFLNGILSKIFS
jgi:hypothetical protein